MGAAAIGAGIVGVSSLVGINDSRKARKEAKREANYQRESLANQEARVRQESASINAKIEQQQRKNAAGAARANRARVSGGIFGDSEPTTRATTPTLG